MFNKLKGLRDSVSRKGIVRRISQRKIKNRRNKHEDFEIDDNDLLLAEGYTLVLEGTDQRWEKLTENLLDIIVNCVNNGVPTVYRVIGSDMDQIIIDVHIEIPGTQLEKKSECFIQWRDLNVGGAWGLNFVSPEEADHFITLCKPTGDIDFSKLDKSGNISSSSQASISGQFSPIPTTNVDDLLNKDYSLTSEDSNDRSRSHSVASGAPQGIKAKLLRKRSNSNKYKYRNSFGTSPNVSTTSDARESVYDNVNKSTRPVGKPLNKNLIPGNKFLAVQSEPSINKQFEAQDIDTIHEDSTYTPPRVVVSTELLDRKGRDTDKHSASYDQLETFRSRAMTDTSLPRNSPNIVKRRMKSPHLGNSRPVSTDVENQMEMEPTTEILEAYQMHLQSSTEYADSGFSGTETITTSSSGFFHGLPHLNGGGSDSGSSLSNGDRGSFAASKDGKSSMADDFHKMLSDEEYEEDEDEGEGDSHSMGSQQTKASCSRQRGATRKAGWLSVKSLLVCRKKKVEKAPKKRWKDYWVCLKGTLLLFFVCDEKTAPDENSEPRHIIVVENGIAQAVPEHPKKDNILCLSTAFGDAYLLQAPTQIELENWITAIHSACSSAFARQHGKDDTLKLLRTYFQKLEQQIDNEGKMKKMAELQLTVVKEQKNKDAIKNQILQWGYNLEKFHLESYRLRCYQSSLQGSELPNPKNLLACASKPTKTALSKLGYFSVSSFHSMVSARLPMGMQGHFSKPKSKNWFGTLRRGDSARNRPSILSAADSEDLKPNEHNTPENDDENDNENKLNGIHIQEESEELPRCESSMSDINSDGMTMKIKLPDNHSVMATIKPGMTVQDLLISSCSQRQMDYHNFYLRFKQSMKYGFNYEIPEKSVIVELGKFDEIDICAKSIHQVELYKFNDQMHFGFSIEAELGDDLEQEDQLCVFISEVEKDCLAYHHDLQVGDELLVINGRVVCDLDMLFIENLIANESTLTLTVRSCRAIFPQTNAMEETNKIIDQLTCPPPPTQSRLTDDMLDELVIPAPLVFGDEDVEDDIASETSPNSTTKTIKYMYDPNEEEAMNKENKTKDKGQIEQLLKDAEQITELCRTIPSRHNSLECPSTDEDQRVAASRLRKVIMELIDTERGYLKDLNVLVGRYLEPLQSESFLSADEIDSLFGNVKEIIKFQKTFLRCLEDSLGDDAEFESLCDPASYNPVLYSISDSFLRYMDYFKLYSSFCASHSKAQKILQPASDNAPLMAFLDARNPKHQHSASLASYLIKPIQRVLKYPLLISEMKSNIDKESTEYNHLSKALKGMERVAEHINEMMRVHEEFGEVFDSLVSEQYHVMKEVPDLAMDDLLMYSNARWLNCQDDIGKVKKGKEPEVIIFVFRPAIVIIYKEKNKRRSKYPDKSTGTLKAHTTEDIRFKWMIPVAYLQVRESTVNDTEYLSLWELVHIKSVGCPEKHFQFSCCTLAKKTAFVKSLRSIVKEYNRGKALPGGRYNSLKKKKVYQPITGRTPRRKPLVIDSTDSPSNKDHGEEGSQASDKSSDGSSQVSSMRSEEPIDYEKILENELELGHYNEQGIHALPLNFNSNNNIMHTSHMNDAQPFYLSPEKQTTATTVDQNSKDNETTQFEALLRVFETASKDRRVKPSVPQYNTFPTKRNVTRMHSDELLEDDRKTVTSLNQGLDALGLESTLNGLPGPILDVPPVSKTLSGSTYDNLCDQDENTIDTSLQYKSNNHNNSCSEDSK
ncbi:protein still life, isoforms C/SIF type 2-like isoform X2 [Antedon mediterranea]|uniref:protein still life, isoforms C/SIF type 2-like isoform X2 n=1 Tax=Antedon mediterranea TaxID=105859 RepID=UPI003AF786EF